MLFRPAKLWLHHQEQCLSVHVFFGGVQNEDAFIRLFSSDELVRIDAENIEVACLDAFAEPDQPIGSWIARHLHLLPPWTCCTADKDRVPLALTTLFGEIDRSSPVLSLNIDVAHLPTESDAESMIEPGACQRFFRQTGQTHISVRGGLERAVWMYTPARHQSLDDWWRDIATNESHIAWTARTNHHGEIRFLRHREHQPPTPPSHLLEPDILLVASSSSSSGASCYAIFRANHTIHLHFESHQQHPVADPWPILEPFLQSLPPSAQFPGRFSKQLHWLACEVVYGPMEVHPSHQVANTILLPATARPYPLHYDATNRTCRVSQVQHAIHIETLPLHLSTAAVNHVPLLPSSPSLSSSLHGWNIGPRRFAHIGPWTLVESTPWWTIEDRLPRAVANRPRWTCHWPPGWTPCTGAGNTWASILRFVCHTEVSLEEAELDLCHFVRWQVVRAHDPWCVDVHLCLPEIETDPDRPWYVVWEDGPRIYLLQTDSQWQFEVYSDALHPMLHIVADHCHYTDDCTRVDRWQQTHRHALQHMVVSDDGSQVVGIAWKSWWMPCARTPLVAAQPAMSLDHAPRGTFHTVLAGLDRLRLGPIAYIVDAELIVGILLPSHQCVPLGAPFVFANRAPRELPLWRVHTHHVPADTDWIRPWKWQEELVDACMRWLHPVFVQNDACCRTLPWMRQHVACIGVRAMYGLLDEEDHVELYADAEGRLVLPRQHLATGANMEAKLWRRWQEECTRLPPYPSLQVHGGERIAVPCLSCRPSSLPSVAPGWQSRVAFFWRTHWMHRLSLPLAWWRREQKEVPLDAEWSLVEACLWCDHAGWTTLDWWVWSLVENIPLLLQCDVVLGGQWFQTMPGTPQGAWSRGTYSSDPIPTDHVCPVVSLTETLNACRDEHA